MCDEEGCIPGTEQGAGGDETLREFVERIATALEELTVPCNGPGCPGCTAGRLRAALADHPATPAEVECRWCPPGCKSCEPDDCECYTHQDEPDKTAEVDAGDVLNEGERESLSNTVRDVIGRSYGFDAICRAVEHIVAVREREAAARALREAADDALTMYDPPVADCIEWSEWLRARADRKTR